MSAPYHNKALPEGTVLREWRLEAVLGVGGFGIVYRGKDVYFGETVAIKEYFPGSISDRIDGATVTPTDSSSEEIYQLGRQKFLEEAKILWNLSHPERHPNLVAVRSLFEIHGTAYMVMDFESGVSLSQMLRDGRKFDEQSLMALIRPVAEGLERAHQAGVLHRDIKPANILVNKEGRPVLIDFGSARFESNQATSTKVTFYTPPYAAIEQYVKSYPQGPWTDIYALGVVMYQCVTGEKPPEVLERMHGEDSHALSARDWPGFSRTFIRSVESAMAIRPLERPATISAWLKQFDAKTAEPVDEPTRIATGASSRPAPSPQPAPRPAPAKPEAAKAKPPRAGVIAQGASSQAAPHAAIPPKKGSSKFTMMALGAAALFAVLAGVGFIVTRQHKPATVTTPDAMASAAQPAQTSQPAQTGQPLAARMDALIDEARKAGRKDSEITALTDAKTKFADLVASKADAGQVSTAADDMAKAEDGLLARAERRAWRDAEPMPTAKDAPGSEDAIAKLEQAKTDLDAKLAQPAAQDADQIVDNTRLTLTSFAAFQDAYTAATPFYVTARRKAFDALHTATQSYCDQVTSLANVEKPWLLASSARKNAYKLRQDNAAQAKTLSAHLYDLARTVAATSDLHQLAAALTEAAAAKQTAGALYAASSAATL